MKEKLEEILLNKTEIWIVDLLKDSGAVKTGGDARRLIEQGAVSLDGVKIEDYQNIQKHL